MTLWTDLKDYFDNNTDIAEQAMHQELWGWYGWGKDKDTYYPTDFEAWAKDNNVDRPELVDSYGGEDQGSTYYAVWKFVRGDETVFIKFYGYYASYNGADYEGFHQVFPKEVRKVEYV